MRKIVFAFLVILICLSSNLAFGASVGADGNELLKRCNDDLLYRDNPSLAEKEPVRFSYNMGWCAGLLNGVMGYNNVYVETDAEFALFCLPSNITLLQAIRVVVKYLKDHPESLHTDGSGLAILALIKAFPCK